MQIEADFGIYDANLVLCGQATDCHKNKNWIETPAAREPEIKMGFSSFDNLGEKRGIINFKAQICS
jgi:hypothetical protein